MQYYLNHWIALTLFLRDPEVLFTLIGTCRLLGVDPFGYLEWALTRAVPHPSNRGLVASDLTPAAYKARQQQAAQ